MNSLNLSWFTHCQLCFLTVLICPKPPHTILHCAAAAVSMATVNWHGPAEVSPVSLLAFWPRYTHRHPGRTPHKQSNVRMGLESVMEVCVASVLPTDACSLFDFISHVVIQHPELKDGRFLWTVSFPQGEAECSLHISEICPFEWIKQDVFVPSVYRKVYLKTKYEVSLRVFQDHWPKQQQGLSHFSVIWDQNQP